MNENVTPETEAPIEENREEELLRLQAEVRRMETLLACPGWTALSTAFSEPISTAEAIVLGTATRLSEGDKQLDGIQSLQLDAMSKGMIKGMKAVLQFPESYIEQAKERIVMLQRVAEMKEKSDE